uniref:Uncharacterized protein n=1 Tax=Ditylum brightwellii TaxID=49249 RepID=A0A7S4SFS6_9STRA|mmetsp:Transcript_48893/g.73927  ORF Transcript_48893/g.73927 Transcript_48893/m.73927 type:complete len:346 (-) Transcript_48893:94-1131(-)
MIAKTLQSSYSRDDLALQDVSKYENYIIFFFPDLHKFVQGRITPAIGIDVMKIIYPPWLAEQCPELRYMYTLNEWRNKGAGHNYTAGEITSITLRNPTLIPMQILGILVGFTGALWLLLRTKNAPSENNSKSKDVSKTTTTITQAEHWTQKLYWPMSFFWFAMMNATSFFAHSIFEPHSPSFKFWVKLDVICTGLSSLNLSFGCLCALLWEKSSRRKDRFLYNALNEKCLTINICLFSVFIKIGLNSWAWQAETLYMLNIVIASVFGLMTFLKRLQRNGTSFKEKFFITASISSAAIFPIAIHMDIGSCLIFGDLRLGTLQVAFFACDMAFFFIFCWIWAVQQIL